MAVLRSVALLLIVACVPAEPRRSTLPPGETEPAKEDPQEVTVCHDETPTGSNISRQVCRTEAVQQQDRDNVTRAMQENRSCGQCGGSATPMAAPLPSRPGGGH
jgi:hypothetical protein